MRPAITVAAVVQRSGRFLIVEERIRGLRVLNQPAGHVEPGETLAAAVSRETLEEAAWHFEPRALLGTYLWREPCSGRQTLRFAFAGEVHDHEPQRRLDRGIVAAHWLTRAEILEHPAALRSPLVLRCIDDFLGGRRLPLDAAADLDLDSASADTQQGAKA